MSVAATVPTAYLETIRSIPRIALLYLDVCHIFGHYRIRNLNFSTAPNQAKFREPAYSQVYNQNKIDRHRGHIRFQVKIEDVRQAVKIS